MVPYVAKIIDFLKEKCNLQENIDGVQFICGVKNNTALNHILIEIKKELFYNWDNEVGLEIFLDRFVAKIRKKMILEKNCIKSNLLFDQYSKKWNNFIYIYDFRGPDPSDL